jgi:hypothetical protein
VADACMTMTIMAGAFHAGSRDIGGALVRPVQTGRMTVWVWRAFAIRWPSCSVRWARAAHPSKSSRRWTRCAGPVPECTCVLACARPGGRASGAAGCTV